MRQWLAKIGFMHEGRESIEVLLAGSDIEMLEVDGCTYLRDPELISQGNEVREQMRPKVEDLVSSLNGLSSTLAASPVRYLGLAWLDNGVFGAEVTTSVAGSWRVLDRGSDLEVLLGSYRASSL